jgi:hypothetical protein
VRLGVLRNARGRLMVPWRLGEEALMQRRSFLAMLGGGAIGALAAGAALADQAERIADQLRADGYRNVEVHRTLLGRIRITAENDSHRREIVVDRGSGEILRDLREERRSDAAEGAEGNG